MAIRLREMEAWGTRTWWMCSASWKINCWGPHRRREALWGLLFVGKRRENWTSLDLRPWEWFSYCTYLAILFDIIFKMSEPYLWGNCSNDRNPSQWPSYNEVRRRNVLNWTWVKRCMNNCPPLRHYVILELCTGGNLQAHCGGGAGRYFLHLTSVEVAVSPHFRMSSTQRTTTCGKKCRRWSGSVEGKGPRWEGMI